MLSRANSISLNLRSADGAMIDLEQQIRLLDNDIAPLRGKTTKKLDKIEGEIKISTSLLILELEPRLTRRDSARRSVNFVNDASSCATTTVWICCCDGTVGKCEKSGGAVAIFRSACLVISVGTIREGNELRAAQAPKMTMTW